MKYYTVLLALLIAISCAKEEPPCEGLCFGGPPPPNTWFLFAIVDDEGEKVPYEKTLGDTVLINSCANQKPLHKAITVEPLLLDEFSYVFIDTRLLSAAPNYDWLCIDERIEITLQVAQAQSYNFSTIIELKSEYSAKCCNHSWLEKGDVLDENGELLLETGGFIEIQANAN
ncbi:MAG: hypothetical protein AB8F78_04995 [Saprospiraceae bacterium]